MEIDNKIKKYTYKLKNSLSDIKNNTYIKKLEYYRHILENSYHTITLYNEDDIQYAIYFYVIINAIKIPISPFHNIPIWYNQSKKIVNMVVEIPMNTDRKLEINKQMFLNPIKYDIRDNKIRIVGIKYPAHYGAIPQTWENPQYFDNHTNAYGDNDPLDIFDISPIVSYSGEIRQVKIIGIFGMIDQNETDWKIVSINIRDDHVNSINSLEDIETYYPNKLESIYLFLRDYKIPDGKGPNSFAFNGKPRDSDFATDIIKHTHQQWKKLLKNPPQDISTFHSL